ncbi:flagellar associated protein, partial [Tribonema minus]
PSQQRNPFTLPSDEEVFRLRDEEKKERLEQRELRKSQKIWEKGLTTNVTTSRKLGAMLREAGTGIVGANSAASGKAAPPHAASGLFKQRRQVQDKESMADLIAKKREMFLVQMSLDTKREEIRKLEEKATMKEEALKKSEQMLEEDALRFDTFLKENDKKAHEAIKRAERETKLKNDKVQEIKKLNQQIQMVQSDMSKHREALEDCMRYKEFLDMLTPAEWFEQQRSEKRARQEARRAARIANKKRAWEEDRRRAALEAVEEERRREEALAKQKGDNSTNKKAQRASLDMAAAPPPPILDVPEADTNSSSGEDLPMYFADPAQLLDIFQALEEQNLFLIQNSQETEHALEELKATFREAQRSMDTKTAALRSNIGDLVGSIEEERAKAEQLRKRMCATTNTTTTGDSFTLVQQEELLRQLHGKVREVYERCGFEAGSNPTTLFMLGELESRLEDLLSAIAQMPEEYVVKAEKDKEKKRRERKRAEQQALQERQQEERNRKAIERSLQAPRRQAGRKVMERIRPSRRTTHEAKEEARDEDEDELKH